MFASSAPPPTAVPALPGRAEFGHERFRYVNGERYWVGSVRTLRAADDETGGAFRARAHALIALLDPCGIIDVTVDEEIRGGVLVQITITVTREPQRVDLSSDDHRLAGGRPSGPRGARGGRST